MKISQEWGRKLLRTFGRNEGEVTAEHHDTLALPHLQNNLDRHASYLVTAFVAGAS